MAYRKNGGPCKIPGCQKPVNARGMCSMHYMRWRTTGDPMRASRPKGGAPLAQTDMYGTCSIDGCSEPRIARGWCRMHYMRWQRHGDPMHGRWPNFAPREWLEAHVYHPDKINCLIWPYAKNTKGRPTIGDGQRGDYRYAYVVMCEMVHGPAPEGNYQVAHNCGKGHLGCINPHHLRWDTPAGNTADKFIHGTTRPGEDHPGAILTEREAREVYDLAWRGDRSQRDIGRQFGVAAGTVSSIKCRKSWRILHRSEAVH